MDDTGEELKWGGSTTSLVYTIVWKNPLVTHKDVATELKKYGRSLSASLLSDVKRHVRKELEERAKMETTPADKPNGVHDHHRDEAPQPLTSADKLMDFVKFVSVVEMVGGVAQARKYLDVIERVMDCDNKE